MKKILSMILLCALVAGAGATSVQAQTLENDSCVKFTEPLYFAKSTWLDTLAGYTNARTFDADAELALKQTARLHIILEREGFTIESKEKNRYIFGKTTLNAVAGLQNKYKAELLTSQGLTLTNGVIDEKAVEFLNQKYGCLSTAKVVLNGRKDIEVRPKGEVITPFTVTGVPATVVIAMTYQNASGGSAVSTTTTVRNGKNEIKWNAPEIPGTYNVALGLNGSPDVQTFTVKVIPTTHTDFSIVKPSAGDQVVAGKTMKVAVDGTFAKSEYMIKVPVGLKHATTGVVIPLITARLSVLDKGTNMRIPKNIAPGTYTIMATFSFTTKESAPFTIVAAGVTPSSSASSGSSNGSSGSDLDTSATGSVDNARSFNVVRPTSNDSVKAGATNALKMRIGSVENIPNGARGTSYLVAPDGTETKLKEANVYYCMNASTCSGYRSAQGVSATVPATAAAGSGYKVRIEISVNGLTVKKTSDAFTVTK